MFDLQGAMRAAASGMRAQSFRMRLVGENLANADTPGFSRKTVGFQSEMDRARGVELVKTGPVVLSDAPANQSYEPGHPLADGRGMVTMSNVNPLIEIADAREAQRSYQANLKVFEQSREMRSGLMDLLRR